jgi:hypothetical protein
MRQELKPLIPVHMPTFAAEVQQAGAAPVNDWLQRDRALEAKNLTVKEGILQQLELRSHMQILCSAR